MGPGPNDRGGSRGHIMDAVEGSLKRLQTDHIDLYQIHAIDAVTPIEETLRALDDLVRQGKVRYVGVLQLAGVAAREGARHRRARTADARFETMQAYYSIAGRDIEREIVPLLHRGEGGPDGLEPARRRPAVRQIRAEQQRRRRARAAPSSTSRRWTATAPGPCVGAMREIADGARRLGRARGARLAAAQALRDERHHRRQAAGAAATTTSRATDAARSAPKRWRRSTRSARCPPNIPAGC